MVSGSMVEVFWTWIGNWMERKKEVLKGEEDKFIYSCVCVVHTYVRIVSQAFNSLAMTLHT